MMKTEQMIRGELSLIDEEISHIRSLEESEIIKSENQMKKLSK